MAFLLDHDRDQALLAKTISEGYEAASQRGRELGRTAVQKIMYFAKALGVPMRYRFEIHHYGPFCSEILRDTEWLIADDIIEEKSTSPSQHSEYAPGKRIGNLLGPYLNDLKPHEETIKSVAQVFAPLKPAELELYATLDYLYRAEKAKGGSGPWRDRVLRRFKSVKEEKFTESRINDAYGRMVQAHLIEQ